MFIQGADMILNELFQIMTQKDASDLFLRIGAKPTARIYGKIERIYDDVITEDHMSAFLNILVTGERRRILNERLSIDFSYPITDLGRFRINVFIQRGTPSIVARHVHTESRSFEDLSLPADVLRQFCAESRGMFLACGPAGNGKSSCIATMIEHINATYQKHIITIEDPIEFLFKDKLSLVNQRELEIDVLSFPSALRAVTQQSPDVIYIANIRDEETMRAALTATELGTFMISTLHTVNAVQSILRILSFFQVHQREDVRAQLAEVLKGIVCLRLVPRKDGKGRVPAYETMVVTPTISALIREGRVKEIQHYIDEGNLFGMQSFHQSLVKLVKQGLVDEKVARQYADSKSEFDLAMKGIAI